VTTETSARFRPDPEIGSGRPDAPHRIALAGGWSLWRLAGLRSAGMPFHWLEAFAGWDTDAGTEPVPVDQLRARSAAAVRAMVGEPRFLEAVTWQNSAVLHNWLGAYAEQVRGGGDIRLSRRDQRESLVSFLAQRYCAKNETIGFFGPVAWARFSETGTGVSVQGTGRLTRRSTCLETWAGNAVAARMAEDERLFDHLLARRNPVVAVRDGMVLAPRREPAPLAGAGGRLLAALDRPRRVGELLDECVAAGAGGDGELRSALAELRQQGTVLVGWPVRVGEPPEVRLRELVDGVTDPRLRASLGADLDRLDAGLDRVSAAAGEPAALDRALSELETCVGALSASAPARPGAPRRRFGRAVAYEDCRRDLDVTVGLDLLDELAAPLALLLDSARWFVAELGREVERDLLSRHRALAARRASPVPLADLVTAAGDVLNGLPGTAVHRVGDDFLARWAELLALDDGTGRLRVAALRPLADALFPPADVGWRAGRQHSPDLMLAVPEDGGRPRWVLGELHMALNTLENRPFVTHADDRSELLAATAADFAGGRVVPVYPHDAPEVTSRTYPPPAMDLPDRYTYWSYTRDDGHPAVPSPLPGCGLLLREDGGRLLAELPDGSRGGVLEFLGEFLTALAVDRFRIRPAARHLPRLVLDEVVVSRESWHVPAREVPVPPTANADYGYAALRAWLGGLGTPRLLFARTAGAPKPWLLDRRAPLSLRTFARAVRSLQAEDPDGTVALTEMLPGPGELWLADGAGRYTSELRVVAVDELQPVDPVLGAGTGGDR
jgi:hypothetical protein